MKLALLFILLFLYGIYMAVMTGPVWGFYLYELIYFINPNSRWWSSSLPGISYSFVVVIMTLGMFVIRHKTHANNHIKDLPQFKWFVLILLSFIFAMITAVDSDFHNKFTIDVVKLFVVMYIAYGLLDTDKKLDIALLCYIVGCAYIGYEAYTTGRNEFGRVEGIGPVDAPQVNGTGAAIAPSIPLLVYYFWQGSVKQKVLVAICGLFIANGLILMNGRGAFLGSAVGFLFLIVPIIFSRYRMKYQTSIAIFIVVAAIGAGLRLADDSYIERLKSIESTSDKGTNESGGRRINFWMATFDMMEDHPMGVGIYGYQILSPLYLTDDSYFETHKHRGQQLRAVHSMWFQGLSEIGWHGLFFFLMLLWSLRKSVNKALKALKENGYLREYYRLLAIKAGLLAFLTCGTFIDAFRAVILYWMILFCAVASKVALDMVKKNVDEKYQQPKGQDERDRVNA